LHQEAQSHAAREQAINTITTRIRSALTVNTILQRAAEELGRSFGASRASIRLEADRGDKHA
jgi:GAF domain-containing protein